MSATQVRRSMRSARDEHIGADERSRQFQTNNFTRVHVQLAAAALIWDEIWVIVAAHKALIAALPQQSQ